VSFYWRAKTINNHCFVSKTRTWSARKNILSANDELFEHGVTSEVATSSIVKERIRRADGLASHHRGNEIRRDRSKGVRLAARSDGVTRKISFARFQQTQFALCWIAYYRCLPPGYTCAKLKGTAASIANLLALIPFMFQSKVNLLPVCHMPRRCFLTNFEHVRRKFTQYLCQINFSFVKYCIFLTYVRLMHS